MPNRITIVFLVVLITACYKETPITVEAKFETFFVKKDESVPVKIGIKNLTTGADSYQWTFEGGNISSSDKKNPGSILYTKAGKYIITLKASNIDGETGFYKKEINLYEGIDIQYNVRTLLNNYPPVSIEITNNTIGETLNYQWTFEGGNISSYSDKKPPKITFENPGKHKINLEVSTPFEKFSRDTIIEVKPKIINDFDWTVDFFDDDYQAPVTIQLNNNSKHTTGYEWILIGSDTPTSSSTNPRITYNKPGKYTLKLIAKNGKTTLEKKKNIEIFPNTNMRTYSDIKLGINSAHRNNQIGAFFSTALRKTFAENKITPENGDKIDLVFLGLNDKFTYNKFISPTEANKNGFSTIPNATNTRYINSQEICECDASLTLSAFDNMQNDSTLAKIPFKETEKGLLHFTNKKIPRIVLFETADKRKGAIKIKEFINDGSNSYILCDIKTQKLPR